MLGGCSGQTAINPSPRAVAAEGERPSEQPAVELAVRRPAPVLDPLAVTRTPWKFAAYDGLLITTPHYRIYTTISDERVVDRLPLFLEHVLALYVTALADLPEPSLPLESYIFRDRRQWSAKTRQILPDQAGTFENLGRGGFTTRGIAVLYYIDRSGRSQDTFAIAAHEGWHQYTQATFRQSLPIWLEEGIATYMEGFRYQGNDSEPHFSPGRNWERQLALKDAHRDERLIPLAELLRRTPQSFLENGKEDLLTYYAQVWALTRMLADSENDHYRAALARVLEDAAEGTLLETLLRHPAVLAHGGRRQVLRSRAGPWVLLAYFNNDMGQFEEEYLAYVNGLVR